MGVLDVTHPQDPYPREMWKDMVEFFEHFGSEEMTMPRGRYACARALQTYGLAFFAGRSLGQICHIVNLAITEKKILGHRKSWLVPYRFSEDYQKEQCASARSPLRNGECPRASYSEVGMYLTELLRSSHGQEGGV